MPRVAYAAKPEATPASVTAASPSPVIAGSTYAERSEAFVRYLAAAPPDNPTFAKMSMPYYAARLQLGVDVPGTLRAIDRAIEVASKSEDPFNLHALMHIYLVHRDKFTPEMRNKLRDMVARWQFTKTIGVSMNYMLMHDGAGFLAAEEFPDLVDRDGNNAQKIQQLCRKRLLSLLQDTTLSNAMEFDSPVYYGTDFAPARMLAEFARDAQVKTAARLTLDFMLIQTAAHWHHGYHISTAGRAKYWGSHLLSPDSSAATSGMAYLLFGGSRPANLRGAMHAYWLAHPGSALPLDWLPAWQASLPDQRTVYAAHTQSKNKIFVRKIAWFSNSYGLASHREDGTPANSTHFKESRRNLLKWISDKPCSTFAVLQDNRRRPHETIANAFAYGENPYTQVMQYEGTLLGISNVPPDYGFQRIDAPFTRSGAIVQRIESDGWIFCHGGSMLFAFKLIKPGQWRSNTRDNLDVYSSDQACNAYILETSELGPYAGGGEAAELQRFAQAISSRTRIAAELDRTTPKLTFTNLAGHTLELTWSKPGEPYNGQCVVDGQAVTYDHPLLRTAGVHQPLGGTMVLDLPKAAKGGTLLYDFRRQTVTRSGGSQAER